MAQRHTIEIDLTNENSDSGDTQAQVHPPPLSLPGDSFPTTTTSAPPANSVQLPNNASGLGIGCFAETNMPATGGTANNQRTNDNLCQTATTSAAAAAALAANAPLDGAQAGAEEGAIGFDNTNAALECPICLQTCIHPARLPCGHIFCFLCVKGVAYKNRRCAMCRREIPIEFLDFPQLVNGIKDICVTTTTEDGYQWFYEGRNGWWQYDDRTSQDIEVAFRKGDKSIVILVAGYVYTVDLENMMQLRQDEPTRCRRVKRDLATIPKKGVAGLRIEGNTVISDSHLNNHYDPSLQDRDAAMIRMLEFDDEEDLDDDDDDDDDDNDNTNNAEAVPEEEDYDDIESDDDDTYDPLLSFGNRQFSALMSNMAFGHAIRIADDIIGSTLAHADELATRNEETGHPELNNRLQDIEVAPATSAAAAGRPIGVHRSFADDGEQNNTWPTMSRNSIDNMATNNNTVRTVANNSGNGSGRTLPSIANNVTARQNLIAQADAAAAANHQTIDLFEQTLNNFHALTLHTIVDSSDENDDETAVTTTSTTFIIPRPTTTTTASSISPTTNTTSSSNTTTENDDALSMFSTYRHLHF